MTPAEEFALANRAFEQFTLSERKQALEVFARLGYASVVDRFMEAVHAVIVNAPPAPEEG